MGEGGHMGKRQEAALETKHKIVQAVKELMEEKSVEEMNIEEITTRAGVAKGSFYTHFKRKEDVVSEIALLEYSVVKNTIVHSSQDVYSRLSEFLKKSVAIIEKGTLQVAQQWIKSVSAPLDEEKSGIRKYQFDRETIISLLNQAVERKELIEKTPVDQLSNCIIDSYYGAVVTWCMNKGEQRSLIESIDDYCLYCLEPILKKYKEEK